MRQSKDKLYQVAVKAPLFKSLTYLSEQDLPLGTRVLAPLGKRQASGVVISENTEKLDFDISKVKNIEPHEESYSFSAAYLKWFQWVSKYYHFPLGLTFDLAFPALKQKGRKKRALYKGELSKKTLTEKQSHIFEKLKVKNQFKTNLIYGITGSGKTEIYLELIEEKIKQGKQCLFLVPEISLTPQMEKRFVERFGDKVGVYHSQLTPRDRTNTWWAVQNNEVQILIGARSALFIPIPNLELIIIDEEHDSSFKQEEKLKYHARDSAIMLAKFLDIQIILGSATPSFETWSHCLNGNYDKYELLERVEQRPLPDVEIVKIEKKTNNNVTKPFWMTDQCLEQTKLCLEDNMQAAFFLNRRGMAPVVRCGECSHTRECANCAVTLTQHFHHYVLCHYCGYQESYDLACVKCNQKKWETLGIGTQQVCEDLERLFPTARIRRADRDEIQNKKTLDQLIFDMEEHNIDILVGTQMIAKGLDFPKLHFVAIVLADIGFHSPDFRSTERSFQLMTQVSGRAGRHQQHPGKVVIQTYDPHHPSLQAKNPLLFPQFAEEELKLRELFKYPPFTQMISIRIQAQDKDLAIQTASWLSQRMKKLQSPHWKDASLMGPVEAPISKLLNKERYLILLKGAKNLQLRKWVLQALGDESWVPKKVRIDIDVDPYNMM